MQGLIVGPLEKSLEVAGLGCGHEFAGEEGRGRGWGNPAVALHRRAVGAGAGADPGGDLAVGGLALARGVAP